MGNLKDFQDNMAHQIFGQTRAEAQAKAICIDCKQPALPRCYSEGGKREYQISGLCELCFDRIFAESTENEDKEPGT